jgi:hypothetical protein
VGADADITIARTTASTKNNLQLFASIGGQLPPCENEFKQYQLPSAEL